MAKVTIKFDDKNFMINNLAYIQTFVNVIEVDSTMVSFTGIIKDSILESSMSLLNGLNGINRIIQN